MRLLLINSKQFVSSSEGSGHRGNH